MLKLNRTLLKSVRRTILRAARWVRTFMRVGDLGVPKRVYWDDGVSLALSNLVKETETRASGRVQVVSLADFRTAIGELWDKYQSRILIIAESTIGRMIGKGNTFIPQGDDTWLLLFMSLSEEKAQLRADAIAASIGDKLMGAQFSVTEAPLPAAAKLDLSDALNPDGSLDMEAVQRAISKVKRAQILSATRGPLPQKSAEARVSVSEPSTLIRSAADQLQTFFRPAWCAETESIDLFLFRARTDQGADIYAEDASPHNDATILDLTRSATIAFNAMCDSGLQAKMGLPIPFSALHGRTLTELQRLVANLRQRERLLHLRLEVVQIPAQATAEMLVTIREVFRPYVREIAFAVNPFIPNEQILVLDHIMFGADVGCSVSRGSDELFQDLLAFRQRAGRRAVYVTGLQTRIHLKRALQAGADEVGGPALGEDIRRLPHRVVILQREELMS